MAASSSQKVSSSATASFLPLGKHAGKPSLPITRPITLVGSRPKVHLQLQSSSVSQSHAAIINDAGNLYIRDTASREHVFINKVAVKEANLRNGDQVQIGKFVFRFVDSTGASGLMIPEPAPAAALEIQGEDLPTLFDCRTLLVGRRPNCDVVLRDAAVSNVHAIIFELNGRHYIRDLGSRTGTFVNGEQIHNQKLSFKDVIRIGDSEMHFVPTGNTSSLDELEHLIGTSKLGAESIALAKDDAANYTAAPSVAPAPSPQPFAPAPIRPSPQRSVAPSAIPMAPAAPSPQPFTPAPAAQRYAAARPIPIAQPDEFTADLDKVDLDADPDVSGSGDTKAMPAMPPERLGETSRTPVISSQVVDDEDELDLDAFQIPEPPAAHSPFHVPPAVSPEIPELDFAAPELEPVVSENAPLDEVTDVADDQLLRFAAQEPTTDVAADEAELGDASDDTPLHATPDDLALAADDHIFHGASKEPVPDAEPLADALGITAHENIFSTPATELAMGVETAQDDLPVSADDHTLHGNGHESGSGAEPLADELDFTAHDDIFSTLATEPAIGVETTHDELPLAAEDHTLHGEGHESAPGAEPLADELDFTAHDDIFSTPATEPATGVEMAQDELSLAAEDHTLHGEPHESAPGAGPPADELDFTAHDDIFSTPATEPATGVEMAQDELSLAAEDHTLHGEPHESAPGAGPPADELDFTAHDDIFSTPATEPAMGVETTQDILALTADAHSLHSESHDSISGAGPAKDDLEIAADDYILHATTDEPAADMQPAAEDLNLPAGVEPIEHEGLHARMGDSHSVSPDGEVIPPTDPSPESAQQFGSPLDQPSAGIGEPLKIDELSDSTFGRAVQEFTGSALGSLIEDHQDPALPQSSIGDPIADDALAFLAHAGVVGGADLGLEFEDPPIEYTIDSALPETIVAAETVAAMTEKADVLEADSDFANLAPEEAAEPVPPEHAIAGAESIGATDPQLDDEALGLDFANLAPEEFTETAQFDQAAHSLTATHPLASTNDQINDDAFGLDLESTASGEHAETPPTLLSEQFVADEMAPEAAGSEEPEDLFEWDFSDLSDAAPPASETVSDTELTQLDPAAAEATGGDTETAELAPLDEDVAANLLAEAPDAAAFDLAATMADGLAGLDEPQTHAAGSDEIAGSVGAEEAAAFTASTEELDVSRAERAELFETGAQAEPIADNRLTPPTEQHPEPVARPDGLVPAIDPLFGMSRDFGSFLGGVPLTLSPVSDMAPSRPIPQRPAARPPMFGDTPVSLVTRPAPQPAVPPRAIPSSPAPAVLPLADRGDNVPQIQMATPEVSPSETRPPAVARVTNLKQEAPVARFDQTATAKPPAAPEPSAAEPEPWEEELPELADLAPDLFGDESDAPLEEPESHSAAPEELAADPWEHVAGAQSPIASDAPNFDLEDLADPTPPPSPAAAPASTPVVRAVAAKAPTAAKKLMAPTPPAAGGSIPFTANSSAPFAGENPNPFAGSGLATPTIPPYAPTSAGAKAKPATAPASSSVKAPARAPLGVRNPPPGLTGMGKTALPAMDVFSQRPVDPDVGEGIPMIPRTGTVPPEEAGSRRPPGGYRPPATRKPGSSAKPAARQPVVAEGMEDIADMDSLPPEELLQQEPLELPTDEASTPAKKTKKRWKFPFLKIVLLGLTAGGGVGAWYYLPPRSDLRATLKFDGLQGLDDRQRSAFARAQAHNIGAPDFRKIAQGIYEIDFHGHAGGGFLSANTQADALAYIAMVDSIRSQADQLVMERPADRDAAGDADRFRAILRALYRADLADAKEASAKFAAREAVVTQLSQSAQQMAELQKTLLYDQRHKADFDLAQLKEKDLSDQSAAFEKSLRESAEAIGKLKVQVQALTAAAAIKPAPVEEDADVKRLAAKLAELQAVAVAAQPAPNGMAPNPAETFDISLHQLKQEIDSVGAIQASAKLGPYLGIARRVESDIVQTNADRIERERIALQNLADLKRKLAEKTAAHLGSTWAQDSQLVQLEQDLAVENHRLGAAAGAGLTADANLSRAQINTLHQSIQTRREQIALLVPSTEEIKSLQQAFAAQIDQMRADAVQHDQRIAEQFMVLDQAVPAQASVAADQKPLLDRVTTKVAAVNTARQLLALSTATGSPDLKALAGQISETQTALDARRALVSAAAGRSKQAADDALAKSQSNLETAQQAATKTSADAAATKKELAVAQAALGVLQSAPADLTRDNAEASTLAAQIDQLKSDLSRLPPVTVLMPRDPQAEDLIQITPLPNYRNAAVAGSGALCGILLIWTLAGFRRPRAADEYQSNSRRGAAQPLPSFQGNQAIA